MLADDLNKFQVHKALKQANPVLPKFGMWVSVPNRYAPGELRSTSMGQVALSMTSLATPEATFEGKPAKPNVLRLIQPNMGAMVADLRKRFGDHVSLSATNPIEDDVSRARNAVENERVRKQTDREYRKTLSAEIERYYENCGSLDEAALSQEWNRNCETFIGSEQARNIPRDFFQWPMDGEKPTHDNWVTFVRICREVLKVPENAAAPPHVMLDAYNFGISHNLFHLVPTYKRSELHLKPRPFTAENAETRDAELRAAALTKVSAARLPAGTRVDWDRAQKLGLSEAEFDAMCGQANDLREADFKALQKHVRSGYRHSRPTYK